MEQTELEQIIEETMTNNDMADYYDEMHEVEDIIKEQESKDGTEK